MEWRGGGSLRFGSLLCLVFVASGSALSSLEVKFGWLCGLLPRLLVRLLPSRLRVRLLLWLLLRLLIALRFEGNKFQVHSLLNGYIILIKDELETQRTTAHVH